MRVLIYSDSPSVPTGFASVVREVFLPLVNNGFFAPDDLSFFGVNYTGDPHPLPFRIWPAKIGMSPNPDPYGRERFVQMALGNAWPFDVLFVVQDHFTVAPFLPGLIEQLRAQIPQGRPPFRVVQYIPVDGMTLKPEWVQYIPALVDYPVAYMEWSARLLVSLVPALQSKLRTIYHGTSPETFFQVSPVERQAFRQQVMKLEDDQPLVLWVNRNQPRKDPARALQIFQKVHQRYPRAVLYMHCNITDSMGFNLDAVRQQLRLPQGSVVFPAGFSEGVGVGLDALNRIYNAGDVGLTTARGEGFGLTAVDMMSVGLPIVAPKHTSFAELLADDRGVLVPCTDHGILPMDNDQLRPVADVDGMAAKVCWAIEHPEHARGLGKRAMAWAQTQSWKDAICPQWEQVFREAAASLQQGAPVVAPYGLRPAALA